MVQLVAYNQTTGDSTYLDLGDVSIKANYSAIEIQDITKRKSEHTQSFTLPFTEENNKFFAHFYEVNISEGSFNTSKKTDCTIYVDSNIQIEGYLQLLSVDKTNKNYQVLVFGNVANLSKELGEAKLRDLDLSDYNHVLSRTNIENSWNGSTAYTGGSGQDGTEILYPIVNYGKVYSANSLQTENGALLPRDLKPSIKVKTVLDKIISNAGYSINSTFLNSSYFTNQYMTLANDIEHVVSGAKDNFKVGMLSDYTLPADTNYYTVPLANEGAADGFFDLNGNFNAGNSLYTAPHTGEYKFSIQIAYDIWAGSLMFAQLLGSVVGEIELDYMSPESSSQEQGVWTFETNSITLQQGETLKLRVRKGIASFQNIVKEEITVGSQTYKTFMQVLSAPTIVEGQTVDLSEGNNVMPKDKQVDFLRSIFARYNLVVELDKNNAKQLNIEPFTDYINAGSSKDWTDKLDTSKSVIVKPTNEFKNKTLVLSDGEESDFKNKYFSEQYGSIYNSYTKEFETDFATGELKIPSIFGSFVPDTVGGTTMFWGTAFDWDNGEIKSIKTKPRLFYYSGKKSLPNSFSYKFYSDDTEDYVDKTEYPFCHHYSMSGDFVTSSDFDIRFKSRYTFHFTTLVQTQTTDDVYTRFWSKSINEIYNPDARVMTAYFDLTAQDIADFKYNDNIFVKDSYWRVNKISGYAMGVNNTTKVELIKFIDTEVTENCNLTISQVNLDGTTTWVDESGSPQAVTKNCCEGVGLTYQGSDCWWNIVVGEPPIDEAPKQNLEEITAGRMVDSGKPAKGFVQSDNLVHTQLKGHARFHSADTGNISKLSLGSPSAHFYSGHGKGTTHDTSGLPIPSTSDNLTTGGVNINTGDVTNNGTGNSDSGDILVRTGISASVNATSGDVTLESGLASGTTTGTSGDVYLRSGLALGTTATQGKTIIGRAGAKTEISGDVSKISEIVATTGDSLMFDGAKWVPQLAVSGVQTIKKVLTLSEYQNLGTTYIEILPAQGNGKAIIPVSVCVLADRTATETRNERMIFGDSTNLTSTAGEFFTEIRGFMYNEVGDKSYVARQPNDDIARGLMINKPFNVYSTGNYLGNIDVTILFSYQVMDV